MLVLNISWLLFFSYAMELPETCILFKLNLGCILPIKASIKGGSGICHFLQFIFILQDY